MHGTELWNTDLTAGGTALFADLLPGPESSSPGPVGIAPGYMVLSFDDGVHGSEPWVSDGTVAGTQMLANLFPDPQTLPSYPGLMTPFRDQVLFRARTENEGNELWTSDGTAAGTQLVADMDAGPDDGNMFPIATLSSGLLLAALTLGTGQELWFTDGTTAGTSLLHHFDNGFAGSGIASGLVLNDVGYFVAMAPGGTGIWGSDGTPAGTFELAGQPSLWVWSFEEDAILGNEFFFRANDGNVTGHELWKSDGTGPGTVQVLDINPGSDHSSPGEFTPLNGLLLFTAETAADGRELWFTDGTGVGTQMVLDIYPGPEDGNVYNITELNGAVVFSADDGVHGQELWTSDGTPSGTLLLKDVLPGPDSAGVSNLRRSGPYAFFWATNASGLLELWRTDATEAGTVLVKASSGTGALFTNEPLTAVGDGGHVAFRFNDGVHGREMWISDGTAAGTYLLADSAPGPQGSYNNEIERVGGTLLFAADDAATGHELHAVPLDAFGGWVSQPFGGGCGAAIASAGSMIVGNAVSIDLQASAPLAPALLFFSDEPAWGELAPGCGLHLATPTFLASATADGAGFAQVGFTVPNSPSLVGDPTYLQYAAVVAGGPYLGLLELSQGLEVVVAP